jgi:F0F1-type ATP synthase membrane subunit b/b'
MTNIFWLVVSLICLVAFLLIPVYFKILKRIENNRRKTIFR